MIEGVAQTDTISHIKTHEIIHFLHTTTRGYSCYIPNENYPNYKVDCSMTLRWNFRFAKADRTKSNSSSRVYERPEKRVEKSSMSFGNRRRFSLARPVIQRG